MSEIKLTAKQQRFIEEYLVDFNGTQAAIRAGYSEATANVIASENLSKPYLKNEIDRRMKEYTSEALITKEMVIEGLLKEARREDEDASHSARVSAWSHLGKHLQMFTDKIDLSSSDGTMTPKQTVNVGKLTDEQLRAFDALISQASEAGAIETVTD